MIKIVYSLICFLPVLLHSASYAEETEPALIEAIEDPIEISSPSTIQVNTLDAVSPDSIGLLHFRNGGLGSDIWKNSNRYVIEKLLSHLPSTTHSPTLYALKKRLLLTKADAPHGENTSSDMLYWRLYHLLHMRDYTSFNKLIEIIPSSLRDNAINRLITEGYFRQQKFSEACPLVYQSSSEQPNDNFWRYVSIPCFVADNNSETAELSLSLLREETPLPSAFATLFSDMLKNNTVTASHIDELFTLTTTHMSQHTFSHTLTLPEETLESGIWERETLQTWWNTQSLHPIEKRAEILAYLLAIQEATSDSISPLIWQRFYNLPSIPTIVLRHSLQEAMRYHRKGEILLLTLLLLDDKKPTALAAEDTVAITTALQHILLQKEAHNFVQEAFPITSSSDQQPFVMPESTRALQKQQPPTIAVPPLDPVETISKQ